MMQEAVAVAQAALKVAENLTNKRAVIDLRVLRKWCFLILLVCSLAFPLLLLVYLLLNSSFFPAIAANASSASHQLLITRLAALARVATDFFVDAVLLVVLFSFLTALIFWGGDAVLYLLSRRSYKIDLGGLGKEWDFQGLLAKKDKDGRPALYLTNSDLGCLVNRPSALWDERGWKNYEMRFDFWLDSKNKYEKGWFRKDFPSGFGLILRAKDLKNYYMAKIDGEGIKPHVRINGVWETARPISAWLLKDTDCNRWVPLKLIIKDNGVTLVIDNQSVGSYVLPTVASIPQKDREGKETQEAKIAAIPFRERGSIGFRAYGYWEEEVYISNLSVTPI